MSASDGEANFTVSAEDDFSSTLGDFSSQVGEANDSVSGLEQTMGDASDSAGGMEEAMGAASAATGATGVSSLAALGGMNALGRTMMSADMIMTNYTNTSNALAKAHANVTDAEQKLTDAQSAVTKATSDAASADTALLNAQQAVSDAQHNLADAQNEEQDATSKLAIAKSNYSQVVKAEGANSYDAYVAQQQLTDAEKYAAEASSNLTSSKQDLSTATSNLTKETTADKAAHDAVTKAQTDEANAQAALQKAQAALTQETDKSYLEYAKMGVELGTTLPFHIGHAIDKLGNLKDFFTQSGDESEVMATTTDASFGEMDTAAETSSAVMDALPMVAILSAIIIAVTLLYEAWTNNWGGIRDKVTAVWNDVKPVFEAIGTAMIDIGNIIVGAVSTVIGAWNSMHDAAGNIWNGLLGIIKPIVNTIIDYFNGFVNAADVILKAVNAVSGTLHLGTLPLIPDIPHLQHGGITTGPGLFVAGEAGPELLMGASVRPLSSSSSSTTTTGGNSTQINFSIDTMKVDSGVDWQFEIQRRLDDVAQQVGSQY